MYRDWHLAHSRCLCRVTIHAIPWECHSDHEGTGRCLLGLGRLPQNRAGMRCSAWAYRADGAGNHHISEAPVRAASQVGVLGTPGLATSAPHTPHRQSPTTPYAHPRGSPLMETYRLYSSSRVYRTRVPMADKFLAHHARRVTIGERRYSVVRRFWRKSR